MLFSSHYRTSASTAPGVPEQASGICQGRERTRAQERNAGWGFWGSQFSLNRFQPVFPSLATFHLISTGADAASLLAFQKRERTQLKSTFMPFQNPSKIQERFSKGKLTRMGWTLGMTIATKPGMLEKRAVNKVTGPKPALHICVCVCIFHTMEAIKKPASSQPYKCKRTAVTSIIKMNSWQSSFNNKIYIIRGVETERENFKRGRVRGIIKWVCFPFSSKDNFYLWIIRNPQIGNNSPRIPLSLSSFPI